jgi:AraC-like DNA-binding protein
MTPIVVLLRSATARSQLATALREIIVTPTIAEAARVLEATEATETAPAPPVLVTELRDEAGVSLVEAVVALADRRSMRVVVSFAPTPTETRDVLHAVARGLRAQWVVRWPKDPAALVAAVERARTADRIPSPATEVLRVLAPLAVPDGVRPFLVFAAVTGDRALSVEAAAQALAISDRTLELRLAHAGFAAPHRILGWCRALYAAWYLDVRQWSPKHVALALQFGSVSALSHWLRRYGAPAPNTLRRLGGFAELVAQFSRALRSVTVPARPVTPSSRADG